MKNWILKPISGQIQAIKNKIAHELQITPAFAEILLTRLARKQEDLIASANIKAILKELNVLIDPVVKHLIQPHSLPDVDKAACLIVSALLNKEKILIWGDYDVDGITGTALCLQVLRFHGFNPAWHLPNRKEEGYGLNAKYIEKFADEGITLLLTVDCGISDTKAIATAKACNMTVVISDHHIPPSPLPQADAFCNPYCTYLPKVDENQPWNSPPLAGVGVAFFLMAQVNTLLSAQNKKKFDMREVLDLTALGSIADMVPLTGQNRILAKNGLLKIAEAKRAGIAELKEVAGYQASASLSAGQIAFGLAPRINAAGRMDSANTALELLLSTDHEQARILALKLNEWNEQRKKEEEETVKEALEQAESFLHDPALVLCNEHWNQGIIGIVASRMVEKYYKPTFILTQDSMESVYKGSGRSISEFDLNEGLVHCQDLLLSFGGHKAAAGLRIDKENIALFRTELNNYVTEKLGAKPLTPSIKVDAILNFAEASNFIFLKELELLEPYGIGHGEPVFQSPVLTVKNQVLFGNGKNHVKLELYDASSNQTLFAKAWNIGQTLASLKNQNISLAYSLGIDNYSGIPTVDIKIKDINETEK